MESNLFRDLQQRLDQYSLGFPATQSGIEIQILKKLFTEADAQMFLALSPMLETPESVADRLSQPVEAVAARLEDMAARKLLFRIKKPESVRYGAIPFVHGLFEFQVSQLDRELAGMLDQYYGEGFKEAMIKGADTFLRTIPISEALSAEQHIAPYEDVKALLEKMKQIVVTDCICRKQKQLMDKGCGKPLEVCFMFGSMGQYYLDHNMGRKVDADEALRIVADAQAAGLVTQPATTQNPGGMCNCCGDCCGVSGLSERPGETGRSGILQLVCRRGRKILLRMRNLSGSLPDECHLHE